MTSRRAGWDLSENPLSAALEARRRHGDPFLDLVESNPTRVGLSYPEAEVRAALSSPGVLAYDPSAAGLRAARDAVGAYYGARGEAVDPERIVLTASTSEAYSFVFKLLADPGDEVLVPRPSYPLFDYLAGLDGVVVRPYRLDPDAAFRLDVPSIARALGPRTRAIVLVHPNNPTGSFVTRAEIDAVAALARERGVALVSDEVFADYAYAPDAARAGLVAARDDVLAFSLSGLSKLALLPQVKLGWIVVGGPNDLRADALARLEVVADTYLSVSASAQHGASGLLRIGETLRARLLERVVTNRRRLEALVAAHPAVALLPADGGWYAILRVPRLRSDADLAVTLLEDDGVYVHPGSFYDLEGGSFLVLSLIVAPDVFDDGAARLLRRLAAEHS